MALGIRQNTLLGFNEAEIATWISNQLPVLEIGPGRGVSSQQLIDRKVNLFVLEPTLKYSYRDDPWLEEAKTRFSSNKFQHRVSAANAADTTLAFPDHKFQAAFAIGPNFQSYSANELALINSIGGVLHALTNNDESFFAFETSKDGTVEFDIQTTRNHATARRFRLVDFLNDNNIRYTRNTYFDGMYPNASAIRIFRQSRNGQDTAPAFDRALSQDMSTYVITP